LPHFFGYLNWKLLIFQHFQWVATLLREFLLKTPMINTSPLIGRENCGVPPTSHSIET
jgi:hypothetical protein